MNALNSKTLINLFAGIALALGSATGCSSSGPGDIIEGCEDGKCDDPGSAANTQCRADCSGSSDANCFDTCRKDAAFAHCEARRSDALNSAQKAFTKDAIRWAAADVEGVNQVGGDDRGQEYTEYFAIVQPPPAQEGGELGPAVDLGRQQGNGRPTTPASLDLTEDQIFALEDEPDAVVGQCVFTSWHADVPGPLAVCGDSEATCPNLTFAEDAKLPSWSTSSDLGFPLAAQYMQMKIGFNSNSAASDLAWRCMTDPLEADANNPEDPLHDNYTRGCMKAFDLFQTEWRRSDSAVCVAGGRLAECGCGVDTDGDGVANITDPKEVAFALVPPQPNSDGSVSLRGFPLGTWSDASELPAGCRYVDVGDGSQTMVACDLTGSDLLASASDPKGRCREKYGDNVVVHVPVPSAAVVCAPPAGAEESCGAMPWVVGAEGTAEPTTDPDPEPTASCTYDMCNANQTTPGTECASNACVTAICDADDFCCANSWDDVCAGAAQAEAACGCN
jgi:hypothetical protein